MPKVLFSSITGMHNKGVEALVLASIDALKDSIPDASISLLSSDPTHDRLRVPREISVYSDGSPNFGRKGLAQIRSKLSRFVSRLERRVSEMLAAVRGCDALIATGGDIFSSDYSPQSLRKHCDYLSLAQQFGKRTFILSQSIGRFTSQEDVSYFSRVAKNCTLISVREAKSYRYVIDELGIDRQKVILTADPAFLLTPSDRIWSKELLKSIAIVEGVGSIVVVPSEGIANYRKIGRASHDDAWKRLVLGLLEKTSANIIILPHVHDPFPLSDDREIATRLYTSLLSTGRVRMVPGNLSSRDYKAVIAEADLVVSERMHPAIAGLSSAVPTIPIRYSVKADGIIGDLFPGDSAEELFINIEEFDDTQIVLGKILRAFARKEELRQTLVNILPEIRQRAAFAFLEIARRL